MDQRKMNAVRAYFEWMPIRQVEMDDNLRIWRNFEIGDLMDLIMVCRLYTLFIAEFSTLQAQRKAVTDQATARYQTI